MTASHSLSGLRPANNMPLSAITSGKLDKPPRVLLYGVEKIGKSTFAAAAPSPIFLCSEDGTAELDVARFPEPTCWEEARYAIDSLARNPHDYKTFVVDTVDWLEPLCWSAVCRKGSVESIEKYDGGYGKGYVAALDNWRDFLSDLDELRHKRGMGIILLAHSWVKAFHNPEGEDFDRYEMKLHAKTGALLKEWCDALLFATYETFTHEKKGKVKGIASGARIVHTERMAAWDAGNRYDLPETLPLDWASFADAMKAKKQEEPAALKERIAELLKSVTDAEIQKRVTVATAAAENDAPKLAKIANTLSAMVEPKRKAG